MTAPAPARRGAAALHATALAAGLLVMVVEIGGTRALAPYFGASLKVWTGTITSTMAFLALGYALGGRLSLRRPAWALPGLLGLGGLSLCLYPLLRAFALEPLALGLGVSVGSLAAASLLFGPALAALGAVTPLLLAEAGQGRDGGGMGAMAGALFFTNTMGCLLGGWLTALVLIPHLPMRVSLVAAGLAMALVGAAWALAARRRLLAVAAAAACLGAALCAPRPVSTHILDNGARIEVLESRQTATGLVQVADVNGRSRVLFIDGITQGGMSLASGLSSLQFTESLNYLAWRHNPGARSALLLGLGAGTLAKELAARGVSVTAAEIEPAVADAARRHFGLPDGVTVRLMDGRAALAEAGHYDLVVLDAFAGENAPWHLATEQALRLAKARLNPGGLMLVNTVAAADGGGQGLLRFESGLARVFAHGRAYQARNAGGGLSNATLVAGDAPLEEARGQFPAALEPGMLEALRDLETAGRPLRAGGPVAQDDFCDLDHAEAALRAHWRGMVLKDLGPQILGD